MRQLSLILSLQLFSFLPAVHVSAQPAEMINPPGATDIRESANKDNGISMMPIIRRPSGLDRASRKELENLRHDVRA